jgi:hypothetical protein
MIDASTALKIARARADQRGWAFAEPVQVQHRRHWFGSGGRYEVETNAGRRGTKARFVIDAANGQILSEAYISR